MRVITIGKDWFPPSRLHVSNPSIRRAISNSSPTGRSGPASRGSTDAYALFAVPRRGGNRRSRTPLTSIYRHIDPSTTLIEDWTADQAVIKAH
jgi:hypothetical protein